MPEGSDHPAGSDAVDHTGALDHPGLTTRFGALENGEGGEMTLLGRLVSASNQTFLAEISCVEQTDDSATSATSAAVKAVYKPVAGERPLWDFPGRTLGFREIAAYQMSDCAGFHLVPYTAWVEGPLGPGSLQVWVDDDPDDAVIDLVASEDVEEERQARRGNRRFADCLDVVVQYAGREWYSVLDGLDGRDRDVTLLHAADDRLRSMALFDAVINNADRKGGHLIPMPAGHVYGIDHGVSFHQQDKLRTVLWGWAGDALPDDAVDALSELRAQLEGPLDDALSALLTRREVAAVRRRVDRLLECRQYPQPSGDWPAVPWPPF